MSVKGSTSSLVAGHKKAPQNGKQSPTANTSGFQSAKSRRVTPSAALAQAMTHVKDFMTDAQKALVLLREGKNLLDINDPRGALDCFNEGIAFNPTINLFNYRAVCHKFLDMYTEAFFDYSYNIRLEPESGLHFCNRGLCLARLKKLSLAIEDLDLAIEYEPSANHYYARACVYADFGHFQSAINDYTTALAEDTNSPGGGTVEFKLKCRYRRALAHFDLARYEDVTKDCMEVLNLDANNVPARSLLGRSCKIVFEYAKAEEHLSNAILIDTDQPSLYSERGDIRFRTGQKNKIIEAIYDFDKAVKLIEQRLLLLSSHNHSNSSHGMTSSRSVAFVHNVRLGSGHGSKHGSFNSNSSIGRLVAAVRDNFNEQEENDHLPRLQEEEEGEQPPSILKVTVEDRATTTGSSPRKNSNNNKPLSSHSKDSQHSSSNPELLLLTSARQAMPSTPAKFDISSVLADRNNPVAIPQQRRELQDQLADTLYKRAQAKVMIHADPVNIESALSDALQAVRYVDTDDDFHLMAATCLIRLGQHDHAVSILENVLERSPNNLKAIYNLSFCRRASGYQKDAIDGLTKIIAISQPDMAGLTNTALAVPIHRVYEMRGTLFHEIQAHKLALLDLGKAIAINPSHAENYFLRGDCHVKLGNYEQALQDYNQADTKGFHDRCSLLISRGMVHRLLQDHHSAMEDFQAAAECMDINDRIGLLRAQSFIAFCHIDMKNFIGAEEMLRHALQINESMLRELTDHKSKLQHHQVNDDNEGNSTKEKNYSSSNLSNNIGDIDDEFLYAKRMSWIILYHMTLCQYMSLNYEFAVQTALLCLCEEYEKFIPDDMTAGTLRFFIGEMNLAIGNYNEALECLEICAKTNWSNTSHNEFLLYFATAKAHQSLRNHEQAIQFFTAALKIEEKSPHCHFRRAWSFKALGDFVAAGDDFETAKACSSNNPNFSVDYKRISKFELMEVADEPDAVEPFPALLPVPGMMTK